MATTSTIGTTGRDYSTIQAWHDAFATGGWIGECYNDSEFAVTSTISLSGKTTSVTDFMTLRCGAGQSFRDHADKLTNPLKYDQTKGVGVSKTNSYDNVLAVAEPFTTITGIQFKHVFGLVLINDISSGASSNVIEDCILSGDTNNSPVLTWRMGTARNCIIINIGSNGSGVSGNYPVSTPVFVNLTIVRPSDVTAAGNGIAAGSGTYTVKNCAAFGFTNFSSGGTPGGSNNCSSTTISFGTSNQASKTYANQFVGTTNAAQDFRLKTGADCIDTGVTDTTNLPAANDIVGTARPQGSAWDIGAWELVTAAAPAASTFIGGWPLVLGPAAHALLALKENARITRRRALSFLGWRDGK